jgi:hypothetical protein
MIDSLLWHPKTTPQQWCEGMPCIEIFSGITLDQPSSAFLVYLLGGLWLWAARRFWKIRGGHRSRRWWCISMLFGGIAAISAGTSYQAFGYELKCTGREFCTWTSGWEIAYLMLQQVSLNALLIAVAYSCTTGVWQRCLIIYAYTTLAIHWTITIAGIFIANKFMISFELLVLFSTPVFVVLFALNCYRYIRYKKPMDLALLGVWVILAMTNALYFAYMLLGFTQALWAQGYWFSENDVLHVLMMGWVLYLGLIVSTKVEDARSVAA